MGAAHENSINARFCTLCQSLPPLDGGSKELVLSISRELDDIAIDLAEDKELRCVRARVTAAASLTFRRATVGIDEPTIWPTLQHIWGIVSEKAVSQEDDESTRIIITSICRFTRNLVAGVAENQRNALYVRHVVSMTNLFGLKPPKSENEPSLRRILHVYSSWTSSQDPGSFPLVRMAVQTLSNMVTANENLLSHLWEKYLNMSEDQAIFVRTLSPDGRVVAEKSVELLRLLDVFLPRINFGKPVGSSVSPGLTAADDPTGFLYLKRDLVRLLGIPVIMNMCVIDERNPYLREHAIFTIHNLLEGNNDNQAVVNSIQLSDSRETKQECLAGSSAIPQHVQLAR
ncbi:hypothetical protein ID866_8110 [Astraeus odoratus]|nr:hypothetical protein ID866_8110 [Astraeus odoratus]